MTNPFFSIITVSYNDSWALTKTARSVFSQSFQDFEYIIIDGASGDQTPSVMAFWEKVGLLDFGVSEKDGGVYNAMNKGLKQARGSYVCFLNASDVFSNDLVLDNVHKILQNDDPNKTLDGILGWGELNGQIWASWIESEAFKMASLGFCHQSLYVKRELLLSHQFDERKFKTDSDTLQLGRLYASGADIAIYPQVLAVRGGEPGISADLERTKISILDTLAQEYPSMSEETADQILSFRRKCLNPDAILQLLKKEGTRLRKHIAYMVLDTLFQKASVKLEKTVVSNLQAAALEALNVEEGSETKKNIEKLITTQNLRSDYLKEKKAAKVKLTEEINLFQKQEEARIRKIQTNRHEDFQATTANVVVSLTSFPARLPTVHLAIQSLLEQTIVPKEIHLWLGQDEIPNENWLPSKLRALKERGLQIHFTTKTFHQYDKFMHNSDLNKDVPFIIVDDDVIYPPTSIQHLVQGHQKYPAAVIANRCHQMGLEADGNLKKYSEWQREVSQPHPSLQLLPTGAGGVLYPPGFLSDGLATDLKVALANAPYADDIWLKACALARKIPTFATTLSHKSDWYHRYTPTMRLGTLMDTNVDLGLNDLQIAQCADWLTDTRPDWRAELLEDNFSEGTL
ncbi:glycosyltransferase [Neptunicoccus sediminis]|uniref:glycosyltransferase n=1 Tax=Neptunicoccus sediminis TaxID=1892596 RepID=UPI00084613B4|nr:glycosyltransferase [Neptunicoccus sediminis]